MSTGTEQSGFTPVGAGKPALIILRAPGTHDSRIMREADTLRKMGYRPVVLAVTSDDVSERHSVQQGIPIVRLSPSSPFAWLRPKLRRSDRGAATGESGGGGEGGPMALAIRLHRLIRTLDFYRQAIGAVRRLRPAILHCNDYNTMWIGVFARVMGGVAVVYDAHELWPDRNQRPEPRWWLLACEFLFVRCAHRTIAASPGYAEVMARRYRIEAPEVIRNIPAAAWSPSPEANGGDPVALYVGALTTGRGIEISIRAMAQLQGARLRLVGPAREHYREELAELARREGVADRVEFTGAVPHEELLETISKASVGLALIQPICLSYRMSLPNKLFEYVAAGLPVLGSDFPAIGSLIREHRIGLVAQPDRLADVTAKLSEMLEPGRNRQFRLAAQVAASQLSWEREAELLSRVYSQATAASEGRDRSR